jgi:hypothetical protein
MAAQASAFVFEQLLTSNGIARESRRPRRIVRERVEIGDDGGSLEIVERLVGRHGSSGNALFHDLDQLVFSARRCRCPAELAFTQIGVGDGVAIRSVASCAVGSIETSAIFDVGSRVAVLRQSQGR